MKRILSIVIIAVMALSTLALTSCGSEFACKENEEKHMTITAKRADKDSFFMVGTLEVGDGEQVSIDSNLEKGAVTIEFVSPEGMDDPENAPDVDADATYTAHVSGTESQAVSFGSGSYMVKATVDEKATGTIDINVSGNN